MKVGIFALLALVLAGALWFLTRGSQDGGDGTGGAAVERAASVGSSPARLEGTEADPARTNVGRVAPPPLEGQPGPARSGAGPAGIPRIRDAATPGTFAASMEAEFGAEFAFFEEKYADQSQPQRRQALETLEHTLQQTKSETIKARMLSSEEFRQLELEIRWLQDNQTP